MGRGEAAGRRCEPHGQSALIAAYREGLGLAAIAVTRGPGGMRNFALGQGGGGLAAAAVAEGRWWCRRAADAERLAAAAMRLQRRESRNGAGPAVPEIASSVASRDASDALVLADEAITGAAKRLNLMLLTGDEIAAEALAVIARVDEEIERLRRSGELKSVNKSYRAHRLEASARGEKNASLRRMDRQISRESGAPARAGAARRLRIIASAAADAASPRRSDDFPNEKICR